ncbi:hypothetical protein [Gorillibacterium sp. sgz5001074]|uniref:hypothetical protein n=1 Tax=Gorillibacterium sp. sgz5001074 TaxID=3446695 RepID=UPI003F666D92
MATYDFLQSDTSIPWEEKLKKYAQDATAGKNEYARAQQVYNYKTSLGDNEGASAAKRWMGQIDQATGGLMSRPTADPTKDVMEKYNTYLTNSMQRKAFDPNTDQQYQSALAAARQQVQQGAQTATNNAMVSLGNRGIGNSSVAVDRANQIQQSANNKLQAEITPQLLGDYYRRWMGEQQLGQQDVANFANYANAVSSNAYRDKTFDRGVLESDRTYDRGVLESDRNYNRGVLESDRNYDRGVLESDRNYNRGTLESDRNYALNERQTNASIANMAADNARAAATKTSAKQQTPGDANSYISNLSKRFVATDPDSKEAFVTDVDGLERSILALNLPADQTAYLYRYYGLQIPE